MPKLSPSLAVSYMSGKPMQWENSWQNVPMPDRVLSPFSSEAQA